MSGRDLLLDGVRRELPVGARFSGARVTEVRDGGPEALVCFRWRRHPHPFALAVPLDWSREYFYGRPLGTPSAWLAELAINVTVQLDTGYLLRASRSLAPDGTVVLRDPEWLFDDRWYLADHGTLSTSAYVNTAPSGPTQGWVSVTPPKAGVSELTRLEVTDGVSGSLLLDLARVAVHEAGSAGARTVVTTLTHPELAVLGFRARADGTRTVDTALLDVDRTAAARLAGP